MKFERIMLASCAALQRLVEQFELFLVMKCEVGGLGLRLHVRVNVKQLYWRGEV